MTWVLTCTNYDTVKATCKTQEWVDATISVTSSPVQLDPVLIVTYIMQGFLTALPVFFVAWCGKVLVNLLMGKKS